MKSKAININILPISNVFFLFWVFLLPYSGLGLRVHYFKLSIADAALLISAIFIILDVIIKGRLVLKKRALHFILTYVVFLVALIISGVYVVNHFDFIIELIPYLYAFLVVLTMTLHYSKRQENFIRNSIKTYTISALISTVFPVFLIFGYKIGYMFNDAGKYQFFCSAPNQYVVYLIIALTLGLFRGYSGRVAKGVNVILLITSLLALLATGSRTGFMIYILIFGYYIFRQINIFRFINVTNMFILTSVVIAFICSIQLLKNSIGSSERALSVIETMVFLDTFREQQFLHALAILPKYLLSGMGLGAYKLQFGFEIHNSFLGLLVETGILGFMGFLLLQLYIFIKVIFSSKSFSSKLDGLFSLFAIYGTMFAHYLLRERWVWFFMVLIVLIYSCSVEEKTCGKLYFID